MSFLLLYSVFTAKPDAPYKISFVNATHDSITLKWRQNFSGGPTQYFRVRYKMADIVSGFTQVDVQPPNATVFTVRGKVLLTIIIGRSTVAQW